jgi:hypothetical protein
VKGLAFLWTCVIWEPDIWSTKRSRETEGVTSWYCNSCAWSVVVFDEKPSLTVQQVRSEFQTHVCSEKYSE